MGGSSKSKSSTTNNTTNLTSVDNSVGDGDRFNVSSGGDMYGVTFQQTDHGAVQAGRDLGMEALSFAGDTFGGALDFVEGNTRDSYDFVSGALGASLDTVKQNNAQLADNFRYSTQVASDNVSRALAAMQNSTRSETAEAFNTLAQRGMWVILALAAVWLISKRFK